jgi:O-antigen/teichoic acid export membrane protein
LLQTLQTRAQAVLTNRTARQAAQMTALRFIGLGIGAVAQIYAARQLGPEKLGISGMALAAVAQGSILVTLGANTLLVREYKEAQTDGERQSLISAAYTLRTIITFGLALMLLAALPWLWPHPQYLLATACVLPLIFFESNQALWVLQAEERVPAQYLANVASALVSAALIFAIISPSSPAGSDMVAAVFGIVTAFTLSWRFAEHSLPRVHFDWQAIGRIANGTKWLFLSAVVTYGYTRFEQPMVGWLRSVEELGVYRSAWQIINGLQPVFSMVPLLLYPKLIGWHQTSVLFLWSQQRRVFFRFLPWSVVLGVGTLVLLPWFYPWIYGTAFNAAGLPCALLIISKIVVLLNGIFAWGLWAAKKDRSMLAVMTVTAALSIALNIVLIPRFGILAAALVNLFSECFVLFACVLLMARLANREQKPASSNG